MRAALALSLALAAGLAQAKGSSYEDPPVRRAPSSAPCLWEVPGKLHRLNLSAVLDIVVARDGAEYRTIVTFGYEQQVVLPIPPGVDAGVHVNSMVARLIECQKG